MDLVIEILKFILYSAIIIGVSKYILVTLLRNLAESLSLRPKIVGNIAGFATSVPELLTISLASISGLFSASIFNVISSNFINFVQYLFSIFINKNEKELNIKALRVDMLFVILTILLPIILVYFKIENNIMLVPIFLFLFYLFYKINAYMHHIHLNDLEKEIEKEVYEEEKWKRGKKELIIKYAIYLVLVGILLFFIGDLLSDTLKDLCNLFGVPEFLIGIVLGIATSIPELITFLESQKYHKEKEKVHGVVEATNNLLTSNMLNLFIIQSIGILLYMIVN